MARGFSGRAPPPGVREIAPRRRREQSCPRRHPRLAYRANLSDSAAEFRALPACRARLEPFRDRSDNPSAVTVLCYVPPPVEESVQCCVSFGKIVSVRVGGLSRSGRRLGAWSRERRPHRSAGSSVPARIDRGAGRSRGGRARRACARPAPPRLRPLFLWTRLQANTVQHVRVEEYDKRNRLRLARTASGWRALPRTRLYDALRLSPPPPRDLQPRSPPPPQPTPPPPPPPPPPPHDIETQLPSHTIAVAQRPSERAPQRMSERTLEPTPLDSLLAVAELELGRAPSRTEFPPTTPPPASDMAYQADGDGNYANGTHDDLFETLSEAHYLPELGAHDEGLLESLVEKGCEDNQVLGRALAQLVAGGYEPVAHLMDRLELGSPSRSAAHSLLHLHHANDQYPSTDHSYSPSDHSYPSTDPAYPPTDQDYSSADQAYPSADQAYPSADQAYSSVDQAYPPNDQTYPSADQSYPSAEQPYASVEITYPTADQSFTSTDQSYHSDQHPYPSAQELCELDQLAANVLPPPPPERSPLHHHQLLPPPPPPPSEPTPPQHPQLLPSPPPPPTSPPSPTPPPLPPHPPSDAMYTEVSEQFQPPLPTTTPPPLPPDEISRHSPHPTPDQSNLASSTEEIIKKEEPIDEFVPQNELDNDLQSDNLCNIIKTDDYDLCSGDLTSDFDKDSDSTEGVELVATDLSIKHVEKPTSEKVVVASVAETTEECPAEKEELPRDLTLHRTVIAGDAFSPRRLDQPRAPSRESDAMQSPQPSGIPAIPSSPELFIAPPTKSKQALFLETLLSSPSPKMYTSEVTISKQQCEPLNLGKHRKSASPTVSSCTDDIRKLNKEYGEPHEKRIRRESTDDNMVKISKVFTKAGDEGVSDTKSKKSDRTVHKSFDENSPVQQFHILKSNPDFYLPDPLLVPKSKLNEILASPGREIPALLIQRPELRLPDAFRYPSVLQDPDIIVVSLQQLELIMLENESKNKVSEKHSKQTCARNSEHAQSNKAEHTSHAKSPGAEGLAGDIDAATSAAFNQMLWLPYLSQLEAAMACSQNMDFLKALNSSGYTGGNYPDLSQMFNPASRLMGMPSGFPMMQPNDYDRLQFAMWQEAMNQANNSSRKSSSTESSAKEASKSSDVQNSYVHSTKNHQSSNKSHSSARTSPVVHNYNSLCQRSNMAHHPYLQNMYQSMNPNIRPNVPLPGLQIPFFHPMMGSQRSPRSNQQKSPTSPYYPNNNYLQSLKQQEAASVREQRSGSTGSQEGSRPRISVRSLQNLLEPSGGGAGGRRASSSSSSGGVWRREEMEVGSTTAGEPPAQPPQHPNSHPHDHPLWQPFFTKQKEHNSPFRWTTVTATGD